MRRDGASNRVTSRIKFYVVFAMRKWKNPPSFYLCFFAKILFIFLQELFARMYKKKKMKIYYPRLAQPEKIL
jgi:hypothetical protein